MLDDFRNTYETDEQIVDKIKNIIINIIEDGGSISPEDDTITELVDLITELLPEKMIIKPEGTLEITENGSYDVTNYANAAVNVTGDISPSYDGYTVTEVEGLKCITSINFSVDGMLDVTMEAPPNNETYIGTGGTGDENNVIEINTLFLPIKLTIPEGIVAIRASAFRWNNSIRELVLPNSLTFIGDRALAGTKITNIVIPPNVTEIGGYAFGGVPLSTITLSPGIQTIETGAFNQCPITDVYYTGTQEQWNQMYIKPGNQSLENATIHYNYTPSNN